MDKLYFRSNFIGIKWLIQRGIAMIKEINDGKFSFDGCDVVELKATYGTPLYVYSLTDIKMRINELKAAFTDKYDHCRIAYAGKAFLNLAMVRLIHREGLCLDAVSGGELITALQADFPAERIEFNGNNKLPWEIELAVKHGVGRIIIDGLNEISLIAKYARQYSRKVEVLLRITPGVAASTHDYIVTGKKDSKFGFTLSEDGIYQALNEVFQEDSLELLGFHFHLGSQLFENDVYLKALDILFELIEDVKGRFGFVPKELNIGGGFGINYLASDERKPYDFFLAPVMDKIEGFFKAKQLERPAIVTEPGRSIVGEAGITLYTIGNIKDIPGVRKYVSVDGGMTDNIRPALYDAKYEGLIAEKAGREDRELVTIVGKCCESGDIIAKDTMIAPPETGDTLVVFSTGAYGHSMASNYNKMPIPAIVFVENGHHQLVTRRQSYEDLTRNDLIPESLG